MEHSAGKFHLHMAALFLFQQLLALVNGFPELRCSGKLV
jgi:hypothetical protein